MSNEGTNKKLRPKEIENEIDERGAFIRQKNHFVTPFGEGEKDLKAEIGRYRLIWAKGCHWSNRASIVRELLGLEEAIGINLVGHSKENAAYGWEFVYNEDRKDPVLQIQFLSEAYYNADPDYTGRCTVPALVDVTTKKVVNNDYHRLTNYLETAFRPFQKENAPDLYPVELREEIDAFNDWLFPNVNNATYRMMFAQSLIAYEGAFEDFYHALDTMTIAKTYMKLKHLKTILTLKVSQSQLTLEKESFSLTPQDFIIRLIMISFGQHHKHVIY